MQYPTLPKNIIEKLINVISYVGFKFHCPICDSNFRKMKPLEESWYLKGELLDHYTENAICPRCGSWIRHRFMMELLKQKKLEK